MPENTKGFEIAFNIQGKMLWLSVWGEWDAELGEKYDFALRGKIWELSRQAPWPIWYVLVDLTRFLTQSEEVRNMMATPLMMANGLRIKKIAYICDNAHPQWPRQHARDGPLQSVFESTNEALRWLLTEFEQC